MVKVYYANRTNGLAQDVFKHAKLEPAYKPFVQQLYASTQEKHGGLASCPVVRDWYRNTFLFKSFMDLDITYQNQTMTVDFHTADPQVAFDLYSVHNPAVIEIFNNDTFIAFCEQPLVMETTSYSTDFPLAPCRFDIGQWLRSPHPAIVNPELKNLSIKRGDPIMLVRFLTDEPVELVECDWTPEIDALHQTCGKVRSVRDRLGMRKLYELFHASSVKKKASRAFKAAVME